MVISVVTLLTITFLNEPVFADNAGLTDKDEQPVIELPTSESSQPQNISIEKNSIIEPLLFYEKVLGVQAVGQETTYYCGPASAVQLLLYKGITKNPRDGRATTQANLANDLHTTTSGTPFPGYWATTLNNGQGHPGQLYGDRHKILYGMLLHLM
ncbi:C39 family peptidase [Desulfofundulus thermocisternus]|uniref:C39 family peptidase n=1 Tax=Desulfofundulus thermocisternus TaxID=42471 RepID=UPI0019FC8C97|nr:C39 family peptidase [Desulfofundulus thermocisternus]MBE3586325.1 hypothetical protein [Thermoanaerobacter sp.]MCS5695732.1 C39 family peptidase [Desulfofundulus thermocisternus]